MASKKTAKKSTKSNGTAKRTPVMIRAYSGVFFGYLLAKSGGPETFAVELSDARHIWQWQSGGLPRKAITVEDIALIGAGTGTRISGTVATQTIADVKLIVGCTLEAVQRIEALPAQ